MNKRLQNIKNWQELAQRANWCAATLAKQQGVSLQTLRRQFKEKMGKNPKQWFLAQRHEKAATQIHGGLSVKETAARLGYKHQNHLSNSFKTHLGCSPTDETALQRAQNAGM